MADNTIRYKELLRCIESKMLSDPRAALRAEFELVTLAYADRWLHMRLDAGAMTGHSVEESHQIRSNGHASRQALAELRSLLEMEA